MRPFAAVTHPFLRRFAEGGLARWQIWGYASQHWHGEALREGLMRWATSAANQEEILRGARRSLDARAVFWSALEEQLFPNP